MQSVWYANYMVAVSISLILLGLLTLFQCLLVVGAPFGRFAWGGQHEVLPTKFRIGSAFSVVVYAFIATLIVSKTGVWQLIPQGSFLNISLWVVFSYLVLGVLMNAISRSKQERYTMTPVALVLAVCLFFIANGGPV